MLAGVAVVGAAARPLDLGPAPGNQGGALLFQPGYEAIGQVAGRDPRTEQEVRGEGCPDGGQRRSGQGLEPYRDIVVGGIVARDPGANISAIDGQLQHRAVARVGTTAG